VRRRRKGWGWVGSLPPTHRPWVSLLNGVGFGKKPGLVLIADGRYWWSCTAQLALLQLQLSLFHLYFQSSLRIGQCTVQSYFGCSSESDYAPNTTLSTESPHINMNTTASATMHGLDAPLPSYETMIVECLQHVTGTRGAAPKEIFNYMTE